MSTSQQSISRCAASPHVRGRLLQGEACGPGMHRWKSVHALGQIMSTTCMFEFGESGGAVACAGLCPDVTYNAVLQMLQPGNPSSLTVASFSVTGNGQQSYFRINLCRLHFNVGSKRIRVCCCPLRLADGAAAKALGGRIAYGYGCWWGAEKVVWTCVYVGGHADSAEADTASADGQKLERDRRLEELQRSHEKAAALQRQQVCVLVYADPSHEHYMHIALQRAARVTKAKFCSSHRIACVLASTTIRLKTALALGLTTRTA
eukprot:343015-Pelagomonas_calceolata.AAC.2